MGRSRTQTSLEAVYVDPSFPALNPQFSYEFPAKMSQMKVLIKDSPREGYELKEIPIPQPKPDEVLIKVTKVSVCKIRFANGLKTKLFSQVAICGSDIALYSWNEVAKTIATLPFIPGRDACTRLCTNSSVYLRVLHTISSAIRTFRVVSI